MDFLLCILYKKRRKNSLCLCILPIDFCVFFVYNFTCKAKKALRNTALPKKKRNKKMNTYVETAKAYNEYAKTCNPRHIPTKGVSTGTYGRDYEMRVRVLLGNTRAKENISTKSGIDTRKKIFGKISNCEIKNRCSTIGDYKSGKDNFPLLKSEYILYCMDYTPTDTNEIVAKNTFVLRSVDFLEMLRALNLIRNNTARLEYQIQVFYTSKKRTNALYNALCENAVCMLSDLI